MDSQPRTTGRATTAHVGTNAAPTLSSNFDAGSNLQSNQRPPVTSSMFGRRFSGQFQGPQGNGTVVVGGAYEDTDGEGEGDGSSIMGRAANIASTAKDLLGALWYGANEEPKAKGHKRAPSLG